MTDQMPDPFQVIAEALGITVEEAGRMSFTDVKAARAHILAKKDQAEAGVADLDQQIAASVVAEAERLTAGCAASPAMAFAVARGSRVNWQRTSEDCAREYLEGYELGTAWLRTGPPYTEVKEIEELYDLTRPGGEADSATLYADAAKLPHFLAFVTTQGLHPDHFEVVDGQALKAEMIHDYGVAGLDPPDRTFVWASMHRLYEGIGMACRHQLEL